MLVQTSFDSHRDSSKAQLGPHITVINHDVDKGGAALLGPPVGTSRGSSGGSSMVMGIPSPRQLSRQGSSVESTAIVPLHHHTVECSSAGRGVQQTTFSKVSDHMNLDMNTTRTSRILIGLLMIRNIERDLKGFNGFNSIQKD